jgi:hypothetical protein
MDRAAILLATFVKEYGFSTLLCSFQDLNRTYDINKSAQKRLHEVKSLTSLSVYKSMHFYYVFFIKLKQNVSDFLPCAS